MVWYRASRKTTEARKMQRDFSIGKETTAMRRVARGSPIRLTSILTRQSQGERAGGLQEGWTNQRMNLD